MIQYSKNSLRKSLKHSIVHKIHLRSECYYKYQLCFKTKTGVKYLMLYLNLILSVKRRKIKEV
jgi:hypothetical protein